MSIDGCLDPWDVVPSLRLNDLLKNHTDFAESALSTATFVLAMNKASYERLAARTENGHRQQCGAGAAAMAGAMWDIEARTVAETARDRGDPIAILTAEEVAPWRKATEPVIAAWQKQMKERKLDGGKLIAGRSRAAGEIRQRAGTAARASAASAATSQPRNRKPRRTGSQSQQPPQAKTEHEAEGGCSRG